VVKWQEDRQFTYKGEILRKNFCRGKAAKTLWNMKMCFDCLYIFFWNVSHAKENPSRYRKCA